MHYRNIVASRDLLSSIKLLILLCALSLTVNADTSSATDGSTPLGLQPGAPAGSYPLSDFDNVNLYNGNLSFQLALLSISGRGGAQMPVLLPIEGKWRVLDLTLPQPNGSVKHTYLPMQSWWENNDRKYRPGSLVARQGSLEEMQCPDNTTVYALTLTRLTFTGPDGTEYELRDQLTGGQPQGNGACNYLNPPSRGKVFVTSDGSAATFISDTPIQDYVIAPNPSPETYPSGYLMLRDGTRFRIQGGGVEWMRDRNGNKLTFGYDSNNRIQTITDSLNRVVTISRNTGPGTFDQITYKGFGGVPRIVKVNYSSMADALRSDYSSTLTYKTLFPELNGSNTSYHNPSIVSSITLPNNQQYLIRYNPYGEVARVVLPTGGAIEYDYAAGAGDYPSGSWVGYEGSWTVYRRVVERRVYPDGSTGSAYVLRMTYSRTDAECAGCVKVDQFNNSGTLLTRSKHYFYGSAAASFLIGPTDYPSWKESREFQTEEFASDGTTLMRRVVNTWQQPSAGSSWPLTQPETSDLVKSNSPQITQNVTTLEPSQANEVSKQTFGYDKYTNRTDVYEYDFGAGTAGSLVRRTHTDYLTASYDTLNPSSSNPDLNLTSHIRNLPTQVSVFDATGVERARSITEYDNYTLDGADCLHSFHCPLMSRSNISGFDSLFTTGYTMRGNPTAVTRYLLSNGSATGSVSSYSQFDIAGNVVRILDSRSTLSNNIATTIEYDDRFGTPDSEARANSSPVELAGYTSFAFATRVINPLGHTTYTQFDYYLGRPVNGEDANGVVASGAFSDLLDRPTLVRRAIGTGAENQTLFAYDDLTRTITTFNDRDANGDGLLVSAVLYDQMGRTIETRQYEGGGNFIATQTQYDALGRAFKNSNPFRPWQGESAVWTTQAFDALGRVVSVTTPDYAVVSTSYDGNGVTVIDQSGKRRKSVTDALGHLTDVWEDPQPQNPAGLNYQTTYNYDALDNLVKVTQGSQQRFFMFDSLKRLIRTRNPEQGTLPTLNLSDPLTGNSAWSVGYVYDVGGNLTQKTDARGVVSTYVYDALNRNTSIDYSDTGSINPDVTHYYDGATNGKGRFWYSTSGGDLLTVGNVEHTAIDSYDALGRVLVQRQMSKLNGVWSSSYQTSRTYNRAGAVTAQTYPSGHTVSYSYDAAGRTLSFSGYLGDGANRTYSNNIDYSPFGGIRQEQFGTQIPLYRKNHYNRRGQLFDVRLSTASWTTDQWNWNRGAIVNYYSANYAWEGDPTTPAGPDNNGNVLRQQHWVPSDDAISNYNYTQDTYSYDSLNRLQSAVEVHGTPTGQSAQDYAQVFAYDRWGNRTINVAQTWGTGVNNKQFVVDPANTNRLVVPSGQPGTMIYDNAGNLITDTYCGAGNRTYDAENRMTTAADYTGQTSRYTYNAEAKRVRRQVASSQEEWLIYGIDGELLAEYQAGASPAALKKEYGYRDGQLLVTGDGEKIEWLVTDHLGTPRMIIDQTGSLANLKRHDYLPFGEELFAPAGGRSAALGYTTGDGVRQHFTSKERDIETGLDYFGARYYSSTQARFTGVDPVALTDDRVLDPQQLNLYAYTRNEPLNLLDPTGATIDFEKDNNGNLTKNGQESQEQYQKYKDFLNKDPVKYAAQLATLKQLEKSDVNYVVKVTSKGFEGGEAEGRTSTDGTNVLVTIRNIGGPQGEKFSMTGRFAHEFEHARQFDDGEFHFTRAATGEWGPDSVTYDIFDELKAFKAQLGVSQQVQDTPLLRTLRDRRLTDAKRADKLKSIYPDRNAKDTNVTFLWNEPKGTLVRPNATHPNTFGRVHR